MPVYGCARRFRRDHRGYRGRRPASRARSIRSWRGPSSASSSRRPRRPRPRAALPATPRPSAASSCSTRSSFPGAPTATRPGTAIVGAKLAEDLGLKVGDTLKVVAEKADYGMGFKKFRISGLFKTGMEAFDGATFQIGLDDARELLGLGKGASQVLVMLKNSARLRPSGQAHRGKPCERRLRQALGDGAGPRSARRRRSSRWTGRIYFFIELIIAFLGAFIIANVMMMVVLERKREIGILKSMGMENERIFGFSSPKASMLGIIGGICGAILGTALNSLLADPRHGLLQPNVGDEHPDGQHHPARHPCWLGSSACSAWVSQFRPSSPSSPRGARRAWTRSRQYDRLIIRRHDMKRISCTCWTARRRRCARLAAQTRRRDTGQGRREHVLREHPLHRPHGDHHRRRDTRYKTMNAVAEGSDKAFAEFTNPEDRGTRYLKLEKDMWIYFPKEQDTVKISGHLLKEGMMGSDVSYEDALESRDFKAKYCGLAQGQGDVGRPGLLRRAARRQGADRGLRSARHVDRRRALRRPQGGDVRQVGQAHQDERGPRGPARRRSLVSRARRNTSRSCATTRRRSSR